MTPLSAREMLRVWEAGQDRHPVERALILLGAALPERTREELAGISIGRRDLCLLALRDHTFGPTLAGFAECPHCAERLEFTIQTAELRAAGQFDPDQQQFELVAGGLVLRFRLPNSDDLAAVSRLKGVDAARRLLAERCLIEASRGSAPVAAADLPAEAIASLAAGMAERDPQAAVVLDLHCQACGNSWDALFDIASFLWKEVSSQARRLLLEVHTLARAYGWREADILGMSARRRQSYLELVGA